MSYFLRRVPNRAEAEDLTQQVFLRLLAAHDEEAPDYARAYIFAIAGNLLRDRNRQVRRRGQDNLVDGCVVADLLREASEQRTPERELLARESLAAVLKSLGELGSRTRNVFVLFRLENMKQREIAELYGISQSTVEKEIMRASLHLLRRYAAE